jgi:hypothetical protein
MLTGTKAHAALVQKYLHNDLILQAVFPVTIVILNAESDIKART